MRKHFFSVLIAFAIMLVSIPAQAYPETYSGWTQGSTIGSLTFWGRTSIEINGSYAYGRAYEYACYQSGSDWLTYSLPGGYMWAKANLYEGYDLVFSFDTTNNSNTNHVTAATSHPGTLYKYYTTTGEMSAYDWYTGHYTSITSLITSPSVRYYGSSSSSSGSSALFSWNGLLSQTALAKRVYYTTSSGETYGTSLLRNVAGTLPDWICAKATNGVSGYISASDYWTPKPINPADAVASFSILRVRSIPVYSEPGDGEIVGQFDLCYGGSN